MASSKCRNGKPTAFQVAALKKAGLTLKGVKTYRDAENALRRLQRANKELAKGKGEQAPVKPSVSKKPVANTNKCKNSAAVSKNDKAMPQKRISGIGVFRVKIDKSDVIEALLLGFAKSIISIFENSDNK